MSTVHKPLSRYFVFLYKLYDGRWRPLDEIRNRLLSSGSSYFSSPLVGCLFKGLGPEVSLSLLLPKQID